MDFPDCIRLPFLRQAGAAIGRVLWPGHADAPQGAWQPPDYPLAQEEAARFLAGIAELSLADLEAMRLASGINQISDEISWRDELAGLASFAGQGAKPGALLLARVQAQKALLWRWQFEGFLDEIGQLENACAASESSLRDLFSEEPGAAQEAAFERMGAPWQPVVASAAFFIPPDLAILADGDMARDLREALAFAPMPNGMYGARAPLWLILGHSRPANGAAADIFNVERQWLVLEKGEYPNG